MSDLRILYHEDKEWVLKLEYLKLKAENETIIAFKNLVEECNRIAMIQEYPTAKHLWDKISDLENKLETQSKAAEGLVRFLEDFVPIFDRMFKEKRHTDANTFAFVSKGKSLLEAYKKEVL